jgi:hypothetical protein
MKPPQKMLITAFALVLVAVAAAVPVLAQNVPDVQTSEKVLAGPELTRLVPTSFYFQGQAAPTQMRNSAAARIDNHYVVAGLVDTSGYSAEIRASYQGFFITDGTITIGGESLPIGAYGFGFTNDGKFHILDLGNNQVLSVSSTSDKALKRPRPLMMTMEGRNLRLYAGRDYVVISPK